MKRTLLALSLVAAAIPGAAHAQAYVAVSGGAAMPSSSQNEGEFTATVPATADWPAIPSGTPLAWNTEFDTGYEISGQIGYRFAGGLRSELQVVYNKADVQSHDSLAAGGTVIDGLDVAVLTRGAPSASNPTVGAVIADGQGNVSNLGVFLNGFYDLNRGGAFEPYLGAGLGYQSTDVLYRPSGVPVADESDDGFAWQLMAGANISVAPTVQLFAQYTYRRAFNRAEVPLTLLPATLGVETGGSLLTAGVRFGL